MSTDMEKMKGQKNKCKILLVILMIASLVLTTAPVCGAGTTGPGGEKYGAALLTAEEADGSGAESGEALMEEESGEEGETLVTGDPPADPEGEAPADAGEESSAEDLSDGNSEEELTEDAASDEEGSLESEELSEEESSENAEEAVDEEDSEEVRPAFDQTQTLDGVEVRVQAAEGVFPEGASLAVAGVIPEDQDGVEKAVGKARQEGCKVAASYIFDIRVLDENGMEIQPAEEDEVTITFTASEVGMENLETRVYHLQEEAEEEAGAEKPESEGAEGKSDPVFRAEAMETETEGDQAEVVSGSFSYYTVEFTYGDKTYVMKGDSSVPLDDILKHTGLTGKVTSAKSSNEELFTVAEENGKWTVTARKAFASEEELTLTIEEMEYDITLGYEAPKEKTRKIRVTDSNGPKKIIVTKTWVNDDDTVRPDNMTVHIKQTKSLLLSGSSNLSPGTSPIESKIKQIAGSGSANNNNTNIKAFKYATDAQYEAIKSSLTSSNEVQQSGEKTYMWFDSSDGTMYMYSEAGVIYLDTYSGGMFRKMRVLEDISGLSHLDTSYVIDMNRMFQDSINITDFSPIAGWDVRYVQNFRFAFGANNGSGEFVATSLEPFRNWDMSNVSDMNQMFKFWTNVDTLEPIKDWNVGRVTFFDQMFNYAYGLTDATREYIEGWDVSAGTNFTQMFDHAGPSGNRVSIASPVFDLRPGTWVVTNNSFLYQTSTPAVTPQDHTLPSAIDLTPTEYSDNGSGSGTGSNPGDCVVTKNGNVWTYEFTVPDNDGKWSVWEDTSNGKVDDKNGLAGAYTESSNGTAGLGGSEANAIKSVSDRAFITNTNTKRVEITVYKNWVDSSDAYGLRPTNYSDVNIDLNYGGGSVRSTNGDLTKWSQAGNQWTYATFVHYSDDDADAYTISENAPPAGYSNDGPITVTSTGTTSGGIKTGEATITNTLETHDLKLTKEVTGNQADKTRSFAFTFGTTQTGSYNYEIRKSDNSLKDQGSFSTSGGFSLKDGEYILIRGIPAVFNYQVEESDYSADGYTTTPRIDAGQSSSDTISGSTVSGKMDAYKDITYDNNKTGALPTGLFSDKWPLILTAAAGLLLMLLLALAVRKFRRRMMED